VPTRFGETLFRTHPDQPEVALGELREIVTNWRSGKNELFALAEFSFLHAQDTGNRMYHLAAAVYAYAFLFPKRTEDLTGPLDPRTRLAADIYNRAITTAFASLDGRTVMCISLIHRPLQIRKTTANQLCPASPNSTVVFSIAKYFL
jgi:hypothetical protein